MESKDSIIADIVKEDIEKMLEELKKDKIDNPDS